MKRTAFFTVVYPESMGYFLDFIDSLKRQTCPDFDLIVGNDGVYGLDLAGCGISARVVDLSGTPAEIRSKGLRILHDMGYVNAIFGDSDDFFPPSRVSTSLNLLRSHDVVVNELNLVDQNGCLLKPCFLSQRLTEGEELFADFLRDKNIFGLSNTAVRVSCLQDIEIPANIVAADWFVFASILERGSKGIFTATTHTNYRQHEENIAGLGIVNEKVVLMAISVKTNHYAAMSAAGWKHYQRPAAEFNQLFNRICEDVQYRTRYLHYIKTALRESPFWWEVAMLAEEPV